MRPTEEQQAALAAFSTGDDLVIVAGAGTGKTSTLRLLAGSTSRRGLYLAFNKAIAEEAKAAFPRSVQARTAHSLAYGWAARQGGYRPVLQRLGRPRRHPQALIEALGLADMTIPTATGEVTFGAGHVLRWVNDILAAFLQSADDDIDPARHRPLIPGTSAGVVDEVAVALTPAVARAWDDLRSAQGVMPMTHAVYLKLWGLACPRLPADVVLYDEAQDASPVVAAVVQAQPAQKVMVGDPAQSIYRFTGAVDAMTAFQAPHRLALSRSWRFGPAIAAAANIYLELLEQDLRLVGNPVLDSRIVDVAEGPDALLCRGNATTIGEAIYAQQTGRRVHILGGTDAARRFVEAAEQLQDTGSCQHPELAMFSSWQAVREYVEDESAPVELRTLVTLVDRFGTGTLHQVLTACTLEEADADVVISTVHKSKGREWARVDLADDLDPTPALEILTAAAASPVSSTEPVGEASKEVLQARDELMIGYVAATRARTDLGAGSIAPALARHGFPPLSAGTRETTLASSVTPVELVEVAEPVRIIAGSGFELVHVPVDAQAWAALRDRRGECGALEWATDVLAAALRDDTHRTGDSRSTGDTRGTGGAGSAGQGEGQPAYTRIADEVLGQDAADRIRSWIDQAIETTRTELAGRVEGFLDEQLLDLVIDRVRGEELVVHRSRGRVGYSITTSISGPAARLSGANFGTGFSGPGIVRRVRGNLVQA